jgi:hypothetical protein
MKPSEVNSANEDIVRRKLYKVHSGVLKWKYSLGDKVRITAHRQVFRKGYEGTWSEEIFVITARNPTYPVTYSIQDAGGEDIKGKFYEYELQKVIKTDDVYIVEKIIRTRKRAGKIEYFVKWRGYPDKFNSWTSDVRKK